LHFCSNLPPVEKVTINMYKEADKRRKKDLHTFVGKSIASFVLKS